MATSVIDELSEEEAKLELTPMIDVSFLILIFFMCLPFKTLEGKLQAFLPTDKGINPIPQDPPNEIKVSVHIVARNEVSRTWGPETAQTTVQMPSRVKYKFGESTFIPGGINVINPVDVSQLRTPGAELRKQKLLPYPKKNYNTAD